MTHYERMDAVQRICTEECERLWPGLIAAIESRVAAEVGPDVKVITDRGSYLAGWPRFTTTGPRVLADRTVDIEKFNGFMSLPIAIFEWPSPAAAVPSG
jgi:hypothetical protein